MGCLPSFRPSSFGTTYLNSDIVARRIIFKLPFRDYNFRHGWDVDIFLQSDYCFHIQGLDQALFNICETSISSKSIDKIRKISDMIPKANLGSWKNSCSDSSFLHNRQVLTTFVLQCLWMLQVDHRVLRVKRCNGKKENKLITWRTEAGRCEGARMMKSSWDSLSREEGGKSAGGDEDTTMFAQ